MVFVCPEYLFDYKIDKFLKRKLELIAERVTGKDKQNAIIIVEGDMGIGKTNFSVGISKLLSDMTGREFNLSRVFFSADKMVDHLKATENQIALFDEPALSGLKRDWFNKEQKHLVQLINMGRKKRHITILNINKFHRFSNDIIEPATCMFKLYREKSKERRNYLYFNQKKIQELIDDYQRTKKRNYFKYKIVKGSLFGFVLPLIIDEDKYDEMKDQAIMMIGTKIDLNKDSNMKKEWDTMIDSLVKVQFPITISSPSELSTKVLGKNVNFMHRCYKKAVEKGIIKPQVSELYPLGD